MESRFGLLYLSLSPSGNWIWSFCLRLATVIGQKLTGSFFTGDSFRKGVRVPIGVPGGGVWCRVQVGGGGGGFPVKTEGRGERGGEGWGVGGVGWEPAKKPTRQCACICQNYA